MNTSSSPSVTGFPMQSLSQSDILEFLKSDTILGCASEEALQELSRIAIQERVEESRNLFLMGQPCDALHFVVEGRGLLIKVAPDGRERILHASNPGDMVGCIPFFQGGNYPATFSAETPCLVLSFSRDKFLSILSGEPSLTLSILGSLVERMAFLSSLIEQISFDSVEQRLWTYLIENSTALHDGDEFPRMIDPIPKREHIASSIGTVREVVSRRLSRLVDSQHIRIAQRKLTIIKALDSK